MADISSVVVPESGCKQRKRERSQCFLCGQAPSVYNLSAILPDDSLADNGTPACKKQKGVLTKLLHPGKPPLFSV